MLKINFLKCLMRKCTYMFVRPQRNPKNPVIDTKWKHFFCFFVFCLQENTVAPASQISYHTSYQLKLPVTGIKLL